MLSGCEWLDVVGEPGGWKPRKPDRRALDFGRQVNQQEWIVVVDDRI